MTLRQIRRILHAELRHTNEEFDKHCYKHGCFTDSCYARVRFLERIRTLQFALCEAGGRVRDTIIEPWGPVEGA